MDAGVKDVKMLTARGEVWLYTNKICFPLLCDEVLALLIPLG